MKKIIFPLVLLSLALNAAGAWFFFRERGTEAHDSSALPTAQSNGTPAPAAIDPATWENLRTDDLPTFTARLRARGFPIETIRAILAAQINAQFDARRKALDPEAENRPFWKNYNFNPQVQIAQRQLYREQQKILRDLLGNDAEQMDPYTEARQQRFASILSPAKTAEVKQIAREFDDRLQDLYAGGVNFTIDREKMNALEKDRHGAIAKVLTPAELAEYDLRMSNTSSSLRSQLAVFNPTEEEFRAIFKLQQPFDEQYSMNYVSGPMTPEQSRQRFEAQKQLQEQIKTMLGPERAQDYERSIDYNYQQTSRLISRLELPPATTNQLYAVQKEVEARLNEIRGNRDLPAAERTEQLTALQRDALNKVTPLLRDTRGLEAYKQYGGNWLQNIVPRAVPAGSGGAIGGGVIRLGP